MWRYVFRWAVPYVSEEHTAFNLRVQSNKYLLLKTVDSTDKQWNNLQHAETKKTKIFEKTPVWKRACLCQYVH
jgi:hypothetical protein